MPTLKMKLCSNCSFAYIKIFLICVLPNQSFGTEKLSSFNTFDKKQILVSPLLKSSLANSLVFNDERTQIPSKPKEVETTLELHKNYACNINKSSKKCQDLTETLKVIQSQPTNLACSTAADEYLQYYSPAYSWKAPRNITAKYDLSCLDSVSQRKYDIGLTQDHSQPFQIDTFYEMVKYNVGLLEVSGSPICGGLIHKRKKFITSAHCYYEYRSYYKEGNVKVRSIAGISEPWIITTPDIINSYSTKVKNDWIAFDLKIESIENIKETVFESIPRGAVSLIGYFSGHEDSEYLLKDEPMWKQGLRAPKNGTCNVLNSQSGCLHLACQTVPGFSGTPIFKQELNSGNALSVIGFVSREYRNDSGCGSGFNFTTLATSALEITL